jgi:carbamoyltransferase
MEHAAVNVLGISAYFHDSSAALVRGGDIIAAAAEERFTRQKHASSFPSRAIEFCLDRAGIGVDDLYAVVFYEEPHVKFTRVLVSTLAGFPHSAGAFGRAMRQWLGKKLWTLSEISGRLSVPASKVRFVPHHVSHAAQAFLNSPFDRAAVLTLDAVGEWNSSAIGIGASNGGRSVRVLESVSYPHSLGLAYAAFTAFLGFRPNDQECSTMALAAFGRPTYLDKVRQVIRASEDGWYRIDDAYFNFLGEGHDLFTPKFTGLFGDPRPVREKLPFDALEESDSSKLNQTSGQRYADIAASIQRVLEERVIALCQRAKHLTGCGNLCLAGGVALNAACNGKVIREGIFDEVFVPPDPGDGGGAAGAALHEYYSRCGDDAFRPVASPWLGKSYADDTFEELIRSVDPAAWAQYLQTGCRSISRDQLRVDRLDSADVLAEMVANELTGGRIVGWFQGRFENGPRALGNRSILADPSNLETARRLRERIKGRETFRPFALSVREEDADRVFKIDGNLGLPSQWMQTVMPVRAEMRRRMRAAIHVDGTTRPQIVKKKDCPLFHKMLEAYRRVAGIGAVLNTSFNEAGYPIVSTPAEALIVFARTELDTLVVGQVIARKVWS